MMPIIMDDQSWNVKNKECSLHQTMREKITQIELNQLANILYELCLFTCDTCDTHYLQRKKKQKTKTNDNRFKQKHETKSF